VAHLEGKGLELDKHDLAKERPPRALLERLVDGENLEAFVNTRSPAYKARGLDVTKMTKRQAIDLIMEEPNLMRRPLVLRGGAHAVFGLDLEALDELIVGEKSGP
jgi:arsenate reductase-like glutaredoxin family protein